MVKDMTDTKNTQEDFSPCDVESIDWNAAAAKAGSMMENMPEAPFHYWFDAESVKRHKEEMDRQRKWEEAKEPPCDMEQVWRAAQ
jgi:hypothetical protein